MSLDPALRARIETLLAANPVVLFMKGDPRAPACGFSSKAVGALDAAGASYAHVNVLTDPEIREGIKAYGDWPTIPQLYIGGELVGGSDIIVQMAGSGELSTLLGLAPPDRTPPSITITPAAARKTTRSRNSGQVVGRTQSPRQSLTASSPASRSTNKVEASGSVLSWVVLPMPLLPSSTSFTPFFSRKRWSAVMIGSAITQPP